VRSQRIFLKGHPKTVMARSEDEAATIWEKLLAQNLARRCWDGGA
jgi:hypothetical protein